jgi:hypothetical protein
MCFLKIQACPCCRRVTEHIDGGGLLVPFIRCDEGQCSFVAIVADQYLKCLFCSMHNEVLNPCHRGLRISIPGEQP